MEFLSQIAIAIISGLLGILLGRYWKTLDRQKERDKEIFERLIQILPVDGGIQHIIDRDLSIRAYSIDRISDLYEFTEINNRPDFIFIDQDLEKKKKKLADRIGNLLLKLQKETVSYDENPSHKRLPACEEFTNLDQWEKVGRELNNIAEQVYSQYKDFYASARKRL